MLFTVGFFSPSQNFISFDTSSPVGNLLQLCDTQNIVGEERKGKGTHKMRLISFLK